MFHAPILAGEAAPVRARAAHVRRAAFDGASDAAAAWRRLEGAAALPTQTHDFCDALRGTLLRGAGMELLTAEGPQGTAAILPLTRDARAFARWRIPGEDELNEPVDALAADPAAAALLARALAADGRALSFERLAADSALIAPLRAAMKGRGWVSVRPATPCPTITLDESWRDPERRFNAGRRSDFRRAARRAEAFGAVRYEIVDPAPGAFDALFDEAIGVEAKGWKQEAGSAIAADSGKEAFFRRFFRSACERGLFRIAFLRIDGQAAAMQLALEWSGRFWLFKIGYDERFARCSPGTLLMLHTLEWAARRGLAAYELLGQVEPWITEFWTSEQHDCVHLRTYPANLHGAAALAADGGAWLKQRLRGAGA